VICCLVAEEKKKRDSKRLREKGRKSGSLIHQSKNDLFARGFPGEEGASLHTKGKKGRRREKGRGERGGKKKREENCALNGYEAF